MSRRASGRPGARPTLVARQGALKRVEELARRNCLVLAGDRVHAVARFRVGAATRRIALSGNFSSNDLGLLHEAARAGLGITMLPSWLVAADLRTGALVELLSAQPGAIDVWALVAAGRAAPRRVPAVVDFLVEGVRGRAADRA